MPTAMRDRLRADRELWAQVRSLAGLGELTARWLEGSILHQAGYCDPEPGETGPAPETAGIAPVLAACCRAGFVTTGSQPGTTDWRTGQPDQRAAVEGFIAPADWLHLGPAARAAGLIVIDHHDHPRIPRWRIRYKDAVTVTMDGDRPFTAFGAQLSRRHLRDPHVGYGECRRDAVRALENALQVTLIDPQWGRNDRLWPVLERFAGIAGASLQRSHL
jgi:hypothetical protein